MKLDIGAEVDKANRAMGYESGPAVVEDLREAAQLAQSVSTPLDISTNERHELEATVVETERIRRLQWGRVEALNLPLDQRLLVSLLVSATAKAALARERLAREYPEPRE